MTVSSLRRIFVALFGLMFSLSAASQENVVNVYSGRHYQTDEALYTGFTKATGIKVNRIEASEDAIIERIRNEGARSRSAFPRACGTRRGTGSAFPRARGSSPTTRHA